MPGSTQLRGPWRSHVMTAATLSLRPTVCLRRTTMEAFGGPIPAPATVTSMYHREPRTPQPIPMPPMQRFGKIGRLDTAPISFPATLRRTVPQVRTACPTPWAGGAHRVASPSAVKSVRSSTVAATFSTAAQKPSSHVRIGTRGFRTVCHVYLMRIAGSSSCQQKRGEQCFAARWCRLQGNQPSSSACADASAIGTVVRPRHAPPQKVVHRAAPVCADRSRARRSVERGRW